MKAIVILAAISLVESAAVRAASPSLDHIVLCKSGDPDWGELLERPLRNDLTFRKHYKGEEDEHSTAYPKRMTLVLGAPLVSIYAASGEHEDSSSFAVLKGDYAQFMRRAHAYYGTKPTRVPAYTNGDGPARQDRFLFKNDSLLIGARFARLPKNRIDVRCRYEG